MRFVFIVSSLSWKLWRIQLKMAERERKATEIIRKKQSIYVFKALCSYSNCWPALVAAAGASLLWPQPCYKQGHTDTQRAPWGPHEYVFGSKANCPPTPIVPLNEFCKKKKFKPDRHNKGEED